MSLVSPVGVYQSQPSGLWYVLDEDGASHGGTGIDTPGCMTRRGAVKVLQALRSGIDPATIWR